MKWIKHLSATRRDERVARLIAKHGLEAYGLYWSVQEIIADQMEGPNPSCRVSYPVSIWANLLSIRPQQAAMKLQWLADDGLMELSWSDNEIVVTNAKLLKYRDEYSRKSGHTPEQVAPDTEVEQKKIQKEKEPSSNEVRPEEFANLWNDQRGSLPKVKEFTDSRRKKVKARINQGISLETFSAAVHCCKEKPFLRGMNDSGWTATFDWLVENDTNIEKAINNPYGLQNGNGKHLVQQLKPKTSYEIERDAQLQERRDAIQGMN